MDIGPAARHHLVPDAALGYAMSGAMHVVMDDGQALDIGPDEVFDIPPGHDKWVVGDEPWVTIQWGGSGRAMIAALQDSSRAHARDRRVHRHRRLDRYAFASSAIHPWRDLLSTHNGRMREQLNVFRGREVKTTGDGLLAVFDSPTRAVRWRVLPVGSAARPARTRAGYSLKRCSFHGSASLL